MPFYTKRGDKGDTGLLPEGRLNKNDPIFSAIGDVDELNSTIGVAMYYTHDSVVRSELKTIQNDLFAIGASLASFQGKGPARKLRLKDGAAERLETAMDDIEKRTPPLKKFVIPSGCEGAVHLHVARTIARRAERSVLATSKKHKVSADVHRYLNRLSSYFFAAAIYLNYVEGIRESHPIY